MHVRQTLGQANVPAAATRWHAIGPGDALRALASDEQGLSGGEAARRLESAGPNTISPPEREPLLGELLESLREPLQLLLILVGILSAVWGELRDAIAIFIIIGAVAGVETATEVRARRALEGLRSLTAPRARVFRDRRVTEIAAAGLVPGDVVAIAAGDVVPADCRVLTASGLAVDESALTGEPEAAAKGVAPVPAETPRAARSCMVYAGTGAVGGEATALAVATGPGSEIGRLGAAVADEQQPRTPLQRRMAELGRVVLAAAIAVSVLVPAIGVLRGQPLKQMVLAGLVLAFATIPEELPILVTVLLAVGGRRLARRGALVRRLRAAETIGAVTVVVTDKTGTLTENRLRLARVEGERRAVLLLALACQGPRPGSDGAGNPLESALARAAEDEGVRFDGTPLAAFPFDPGRKRMSRAWNRNGAAWIVAKGAPESILAVCTLTDSERGVIAARASEFGAQGLRVIAFAQRLAPSPPATAEEAEGGLCFAGLAAFADPLRAGVPEAVASLEGAGVQTIMVTGDHATTAAAIAEQAGLGGGQVLAGGEPLEHLPGPQLSSRLADHTVVARATPSDKLRIVRLLQKRGEVVAVTGDGVNDAPALAAADAGIAMGRRGTDLAREAADLILTDDAYPTVAAAIEGGRSIGSQLRRAVAFYLGAKLALVAAVGAPLALGLPSPFAPVHIVLLELFMDLGASVAFVSEPAAPGAMRRPPRDPAGRFLDRAEIGAIAATAAAVFAAVLTSYLVVRAGWGPAFARSAAVATWLAGHALVAWSIRARPALPLRANPAFPAWALAAAVTAVVLTATPAGHAFGLPSLPPAAWPVIAATAAGAAALAAAGRRAADLGRQL
jgi:P-type Ca2+ transporter type 2C